jgi:hypothetical protein
MSCFQSVGLGDASGRVVARPSTPLDPDLSLTKGGNRERASLRHAVTWTCNPLRDQLADQQQLAHRYAALIAGELEQARRQVRR